MARGWTGGRRDTAGSTAVQSGLNDVGLDVQHGIRSNVSLDLTLRTLSQYISPTREVSNSVCPDSVYSPGSNLHIVYGELTADMLLLSEMRNRSAHHGHRSDLEKPRGAHGPVLHRRRLPDDVADTSELTGGQVP